MLRWFRERGCVHCPARDAGIFQATGYRYLHEGIDVLADQAPDLHEVLARCRQENMTHVVLDGTLIESGRLAGVRVRALGERTAAELKQRWRTLRHITLSPSRTGGIARAALVLNGIWK